MSNKSILTDASLVDVFTNGTHNYYLYSRVDGYYAIMRETLAEDEYRYYVGLTNTAMNADWADPTVPTYARPSEMTDVQKKIFLSSFRGYDMLSDRDFRP